MKTAKKLLVLLLTIVLLNVTVISSFASVTPAVTDANKGKIVTVAFTYDNIAGIRGTFSMSGDDIVEKVELETSSDFSGNYNSKKGIIAYYSQAPSKFVCTLKLTISNQAAVGDEVAIKFEYESTVDGKLPTVPSYSYDYATIKIVPDLEELNRQIGIAQGLNKDDYTAESWKVVADALEKAIKAKNATTQREVDTAVKALKNAVAGLVKKSVTPADVNYSKLQEQIDRVENLDKKKYTEESWNRVQVALDKANKLMNTGSQA